MREMDQLMGDLIRAADGEIVGRIRLQKIVYLLEQKGLASCAKFQYYHYGPYSRSIDAAVERGKALAGIREIIRSRRSDGAPFSVFQTEDRSLPETVGGFHIGEARSLINIMKSYSVTVIELAATVHWLIAHEKVIDWRNEIVRRKGAKTEGGRLDQALGLLDQLQLAH